MLGASDSYTLYGPPESMIPIAKLAYIQYMESITYLSVSKTDREHWLCYRYFGVNIIPTKETMGLSNRSQAQKCICKTSYSPTLGFRKERIVRTKVRALSIRSIPSVVE